jgi:hypothetical protein
MNTTRPASKHARLLLSVVLVMLFLPGARPQIPERVLFYVAADGKDSWSGLLAAPNARKTDGPFATLQRARNAVRQRTTDGFRAGVRIRGGVYSLDRTLWLDATDSGTKEHPIVWSAYADESVRLIGGKVISGFHAINDPSVLKRIPGLMRNAILVTDLKSQGVKDYGVLPNRLNLFFRGARMTVARYPNKGWLTIAAVPQTGGPILNQGDNKVIKNGLPAGRHCGVFQYGGERPSGWSARNDIWMHGYWVWDWRDGYQRVARFDTLAHMVYPAEPHHHYGYQQGQRYSFLNVLEELDVPGEWVLDEEQGLLYFWPPSSLRAGDVTVSLLQEPMILLDEVSHVQFQSLTFEGSRACAIKIRGGSDNTVAGCTVRNIDNDTSMIIDGGRRNGVRSCDIYDVGSTGIRITGGERKTLTPAGNYATNNHIQRFGGIVQAFNGGVFLQGVGNIVSNNRIHNAPFSGIQYYGNDHIIEFNDIYDIAHESGDVGGVNTGADYSEQGTVIRYNYIHDTHGYGEGGFRAIYLDLPGSNTSVYGNILANVDIGVFFNSGRDNVVENNIFVNCHPAVNIYVWPHVSYFHPGGAWKIVEKLYDIRYREAPYSLRYPKLPSYLDSSDLGMPYGHTVTGNISVGGTWLDLSEGMDFTHVRVERNLIADSMLLVVTRKWTPDYDPYHIGYAAEYSRSDSVIAGELIKRGNMLADPGFADVRGGDFRLKETSPAWKLGFKRIPFERIGLFTDEFRKNLSE